jgi:hypothetical protein
MATITGAEFISLMNLSDDTDFTATNAEIIIDAAIDKLNLYLHRYDLELSNMTGTAGSKTLTVESREKAAIITVASCIYLKNYKSSGSSSESVSLGPASHSTSTSTSVGDIEDVAGNAAKELKDHDLESEVG